MSSVRFKEWRGLMKPLELNQIAWVFFVLMERSLSAAHSDSLARPPLSRCIVLCRSLNEERIYRRFRIKSPYLGIRLEKTLSRNTVEKDPISLANCVWMLSHFKRRWDRSMGTDRAYSSVKTNSNVRRRWDRLIGRHRAYGHVKRMGGRSMGTHRAYDYVKSKSRLKEVETTCRHA